MGSLVESACESDSSLATFLFLINQNQCAVLTLHGWNAQTMIKLIRRLIVLLFTVIPMNM